VHLDHRCQPGAGQLLDVVPGRTASGPGAWLEVLKHLVDSGGA
jgi:hypothetical protein